MSNKLINGLKPCPFCGRQPDFVTWNGNAIWSVVCKCGAESPHDSKNKQGAKVVWNRRRWPKTVKIDWKLIPKELYQK